MKINVQCIRILQWALHPEVRRLGGEPYEEYILIRSKSRNRIYLEDIKLANQTRAVVHLTVMIEGI
jgi:hypothetical protein